MQMPMRDNTMQYKHDSNTNINTIQYDTIPMRYNKITLQYPANTNTTHMQYEYMKIQYNRKTIRYDTIQFNATQYNADFGGLQCNGLLYNTCVPQDNTIPAMQAIQYNTKQCNTIQYYLYFTDISNYTIPYYTTSYTPLHYATLHYTTLY